MLHGGSNPGCHDTGAGESTVVSNIAAQHADGEVVNTGGILKHEWHPQKLLPASQTTVPKSSACLQDQMCFHMEHLRTLVSLMYLSSAVLFDSAHVDGRFNRDGVHEHKCMQLSKQYSPPSLAVQHL